MTNYKTVQKSIKRLKEIEEMKEDGRAEMLTKKERLQLDRELTKPDEKPRGHQRHGRPSGHGFL